MNLILVVLPVLFASTTFATDCMSVLSNSNATTLTPINRVNDIKACKDMIDSMTMASYLQQYKQCNQLAMGYELPQHITFNNGENMSPPSPSTSWEQYIMDMGRNMYTSGCRDGIVAAILEKRFANIESIREQVDETYVDIPGGLNGNFDTTYRTPFGRVNARVVINDSHLKADFLQSDRLTLDNEQRIHFNKSPVATWGFIRGQISNFRIPISYNFEATATIDGFIDLKTYRITITELHLTSTNLPIDLEGSEAYLGRGMREEVASYFELQLRNAYLSANPFDYLNKMAGRSRAN